MCSLGYSVLDDNETNNENILNKNKQRPPAARNHKKTYKKKSKPSKATAFLNSLPILDNDSDDDELGANYSSNDNTDADTDKNNEPAGTGATAEIGAAAGSNGPYSELYREGMQQRKDYDAQQKQYYNQYIQSYTGDKQGGSHYSQLLNSSNLQGSNESDLMKKLNYVVHMLEEQHDEKSGSVTEELVLYMFLGVFIIFIVDSFSKSSKYKR